MLRCGTIELVSLSGQLCPLLGHKPSRSAAWWDGLEWRAPCRRCGRPMIRASEGWRPFRTSDASPQREARDGYHDRRRRDNEAMEARLKALHGLADRHGDGG